MNFEDLFIKRKCIGEGAFGKVWEVYDTSAKEILAMKVEAEKSFVLSKEYDLLSKIHYKVYLCLIFNVIFYLP